MTRLPGTLDRCQRPPHRPIREIQGPSVQLATAEDECRPWQEYAMPGYPTDQAGLETLPFDECLRLLASVPVGRVGFFADGDGRRR